MIDLISRDLWGGIQERLKIPLSCSMENAVEQNLRHIRSNLERFAKWGVSKVKLNEARNETRNEVNNEVSENSILDTFKMQIDLYKSIKSVNQLSSVDKIYEKQKLMLENHESILQCASEFRDLSIDLYKQVDLIIEFYCAFVKLCRKIVGFKKVYLRFTSGHFHFYHFSPILRNNSNLNSERAVHFSGFSLRRNLLVGQSQKRIRFYHEGSLILPVFAIIPPSFVDIRSGPQKQKSARAELL